MECLEGGVAIASNIIVMSWSDEIGLLITYMNCLNAMEDKYDDSTPNHKQKHDQ